MSQFPMERVLYQAVWERYGRAGSFDFVRKVKQALASFGISQRALARRSGHHPTHVSRWLSERGPASLETKLLLDEALNQLISEVES